jgi:hypothetical protein
MINFIFTVIEYLFSFLFIHKIKNNHGFIQQYIFLNKVPEEITGYDKLDRILYYSHLASFSKIKNNAAKILNKIDSKLGKIRSMKHQKI